MPQVKLLLVASREGTLPGNPGMDYRWLFSTITTESQADATTFFAASYFATQPEQPTLQGDLHGLSHPIDRQIGNRRKVVPTTAAVSVFALVRTSSIPPLDAISVSSSRVIQARTQDSPRPLCTSIYLTRFLTRVREISLRVTTLPSISERPAVLP